MSLSRLRAVPSPARLLLLTILSLLAALPATGQAAVPITKLYAAPITAASKCSSDGAGAVPSTQAGSYSDFCLAFALDSPPPAGDDLKSQVVDTPLGFAGNTTGRPMCTDAEFNAGSGDDETCPDASQIGQSTTNLVLDAGGFNLKLSGVIGRAYLLTPTASEVARIGISLDPPAQPKVKILVRVVLRPAPNVGLRSIIDNLPRQVCLIIDDRCDHDIQLTEFALRFWGSNADHPTMPAPFASLGSDCTADQVTHIDGESYDGTPTSADASFKLTGCDSVPFAPSISIDSAEHRPDVTTATTVGVSFDPGTADRVASPPKRTVVTLPAGLTIAAQIAGGPNGLPTCSAAGFALTSAAPAACPAGSALGTVKIVSPLLDAAFTGNAYVGEQTAVGELPQLYIEAALSDAVDAPRVKLTGSLAVDDQNRIVATIDDVPQVPVSEFTLTFRGGDNAPMVTPEVCGSSTGSLVATPHSGNAAVTSTSTLTIDQDCDAVNGFQPSLAFGTSNPVAGASGTFTTAFARPDRSQRLKDVYIDLPLGQVANLKGIPECPQDVAARGQCDPASRVAAVAASAGVGPAPYTLMGTAYLTARSPGSVAGLSIQTHVQIGDIDLGQLNVPARVEIRPLDLGLRIVASVPEFFRGLPLDLRGLSVALDRPGFAVNPTNCGPLSGAAAYYGTRGGTAFANAPYQVGGCGTLPFAPTLDAAVTGNTKSGGRPTIQMQIASAVGSANLGSTKVTLPDGVGVDLVQIPRACPQETFRAGQCPELARIGTLKGTLSIADEELTGYVYLLKPAPGKVLPGLGLDFVGRFAGRVIGNNTVDTKTGRIIADFATIPDLPLTNLDITINGGEGGPLIANDELCTSPVEIDATLGGQNGGSVTRQATTVCGAALNTRIPRFSARMSGLRKGKPVLRLKGSGAEDPALTRVDLTLPSGWSLRSQRGVRSSRYARVDKLSLKGNVSLLRRSARRLRLTMPSEGTTKFYLLTRTGTIRVRKSSDRKTKKTLVVMARLTYKDGSHLAVPVPVKPR